MNIPVEYPSSADINKQIMNLSTITGVTTYKIFKNIASVCNLCMCKICEYITSPSGPALGNDCKSNRNNCSCDKCTVGYFESKSIELRLLYENKKPNEKLDHINSNNCKSGFVRRSSNYRAKSITYATNQQKVSKKNASPIRDNQRNICEWFPCSCGDCAQECPNVSSIDGHAIGDINRHLYEQYRSRLDDSIDFSQLFPHSAIFSRPMEKFKQDLDCHNVSLNNYPLVIQRKKFANDQMPDKDLYVCGQCQCRERNKMNRYLSKDMKPQYARHTDSSNVCKCSFCECLSCPYQKEASFEGSLENYKTNVMRKYVENEWKDRMRHERCSAQCRAIRKCKQPDKNIIIKSGSEIKSEQYGLVKNARLCRSCQQKTRPKKMPVEEMLDNVYGTDLSVNDKGVSTVKPKITITSQLHNDYGVYALVNTETNTEVITVDKSVDAIDVLKKIPDRVKHYEYTLKIEIITPKSDDNGKSLTKQKIKKLSKNKIKEQTQKVMNDLVRDISKSSLLQGAVLETSDESLNKDTPVKDESQGLKKRSILKQKLSPVSSLTRTPSLMQHFSHMVSPVTPCSKVSNKIDDFIVSCFAPIDIESHSTVKINVESNQELPPKDISMVSQNCWTASPPVEPWALIPDDEIDKIVSNFDLRTSESTDVDELIENKSGDIPSPLRFCLALNPLSTLLKVSKLGCWLRREGEKLRHFVDDLRVKDPCLRRVSYHTVSLRWKLPKALEEVLGYEILVDGNTIEKIWNPRRCLAVVSCLPPVQRLLITIRTITRYPGLGELLPCTTIGYQPRANKFMRI